jgi:hypothetical protein
MVNQFCKFAWIDDGIASIVAYICFTELSYVFIEQKQTFIYVFIEQKQTCFF